jgi:hypothetical protein
MTYSLYDASIPLVQDSLAALSAIIKKGEAAPNAATLPEARIYQDMFPLKFQVHAITDFSQKMLARLTGTEPIVLQNNLETFADFHARIAQVQDIIATANKDLINKRAAEIVPLVVVPGTETTLPSAAYVTSYGLPNIFFHLTTAYDIMRKEGVPLGKRDYLHPFLAQYFPKE